MSETWAVRYGYPFPDSRDLARVMQYISINEGDPVEIKEQVREQFTGLGPPHFDHPTEPHALLAGFPIRVFITTNYDDFLAKALSWAGKTPESVICPWYLPATANFERYFAPVPRERPAPERPLVFHLHGNLKTPKSLVLTEADYLEFLANITASRMEEGIKLIPNVVMNAMTEYPLLFVGYSLQDWTFRVLFHGLLRAQSEVLRRRSVSVQLLPPVNGSIAEAERRAEKYITEYLAGWHISIFWGTAEDFCRELRARTGRRA
jgi:hypothetical protein